MVWSPLFRLKHFVDYAFNCWVQIKLKKLILITIIIIISYSNSSISCIIIAVAEVLFFVYFNIVLPYQRFFASCPGWPPSH